MNRSIHLLVVDDDERIRNMLQRYFSEEGFRVSTAANGVAMRELLALDPVDLVLLDLVFPGEDGIKLAQEIRGQSDIGIIMLTGRSDLIDKVVGLEVGADDYIAKPFHLREVLARVKSVVRRTKTVAQPGPKPEQRVDDEVFAFADWLLDIPRRELLSPAGTEVTLTTGEFDLLVAFVRNAGRVLNRDRLMDLTRGRHWEVFDRTIDAQVARLRRKIDPDVHNAALIKSVRGVGYVFTATPQLQ
jgi:DNA-binding response OmpR family regulator